MTGMGPVPPASPRLDVPVLHQVAQRGLLRAVALVVNRCAIRRPLGLPADGWHARSLKW